MNRYEAAAKIDISAVRTHHSFREIDEVVALGIKYRFINVHVLPCWVSYLAERLADEEDVLVGAPVGFPGGAHLREVKELEARSLVRDGVQEMDLVMNVGRFRAGRYDEVLDEIKSIRQIAGSLPLKVIIEMNCLTDDEVKKACDLIMEGGADFVKTGTGWVPGDANLRRIERMMTYLDGAIKVKAAGGLRTRADFDFLEERGVARYGINVKSAIEIVESFEGLSCTKAG